MISNETKQEVLNWIADGCDWDSGTMLYSVHGKNQALLKNIAGKKTTQLGKLTYHLCKSVGLDYHKLKSTNVIIEVKPEFVKPVTMTVTLNQMKVTTVDNNALTDMPETIETTRIEEYPAVIRRVIAEYAESFQERSKTHRIMCEMPDGNSQALKTKRAQLFDIVKSLSERLQLLYDVQEVYKKTGFVPTEAEIWPAPKENPKTELPDDVEQIGRASWRERV